MSTPAPAARTDRPQLGWALAAGGMLLVGLDSLFIRIGDTSGWIMSFWVSLFGVPAFALINRLQGAEPLAKNLARNRVAATASILVTAMTQIAFITAITRASSVTNVVAIVAASPVIAAVLAWAFIGERTPARVWWAIAGSVVGIAIIVAGSLGTPTISGDVLALLAVTGFSANTVLWRYVPELNPPNVFLVSNLLICLIAPLVESPFAVETTALVAAALMGGLTNPLGRLCYSSAPRFLPASEVALFTPVETVSAPLWVWIGFNERPSTQTVIGAVVIVVSVLAGTAGAAGSRRMLARRALWRSDQAPPHPNNDR